MREILQAISKKNIDNFKNVSIDEFWNIGDEKELKIHSIHSYPAKFPAFITQKALKHVSKNFGIEPKIVADIFCGCGTVAYEAKREGIDFWGCDLNPVATMIARAKSANYSIKKLGSIYEKIILSFEFAEIPMNAYLTANDRIVYWYKEKEFISLLKLKLAIDKHTENEANKYVDFFYCAFSNILKPCSKWLTKSIKPQVDPNKVFPEVLHAFSDQYKKMLKAYKETSFKSGSKIKIQTGNFLNTNKKSGTIDMIITSPPYVTSYEYADLHQLSSLWLGYVEDFRELRNGSIGSSQVEGDFHKEHKNLNSIGEKIVKELSEKNKAQSKAVAKYYKDMQEVAKKCYKILTEKGVALFVIGNTEYKSTRIENAQHLTKALYDEGFSQVFVSKRKIRNKFLTPYRDANGRFSSDKSSRKIYSEEFILLALK